MIPAAKNHGYLLDTHVVLWWQMDAARLPREAARTLSSPRARLCVSVASLWELRIKQKLGKLRVPDGVFAMLRTEAVELLDVTADDADAAGGLAPVHGDPFDRMLVAQAQERGLTLVTADRKLTAYGVPVLDAKPKRR